MKYIPILFSTDMVQAKQSGRKKMTRRTKGLERINANPDEWIIAGTDKDFKDVSTAFIFFNGDEGESVYCPYGEIGDILWVRETFQLSDCFFYPTPGYTYKADTGMIEYAKEYNIIWKPSLFMPKAACRIFLRVTDVRCERLHDITEHDAIDEGILDKFSHINDGSHAYYRYGVNRKEDMDVGGHLAHVADDAIDSFRSLWISINSQTSWDLNPYVWVISFESCDRPTDFI